MYMPNKHLPDTAGLKQKPDIFHGSPDKKHLCTMCKLLFIVTSPFSGTMAEKEQADIYYRLVHFPVVTDGMAMNHRKKKQILSFDNSLVPSLKQLTDTASKN